MAFESLTERLQNVFKNLRKKGKISEADVQEATKEIRLALLEADVALPVVKDFIKRVRERAVGCPRGNQRDSSSPLRGRRCPSCCKRLYQTRPRACCRS